jgi:hypothetical protein
MCESRHVSRIQEVQQPVTGKYQVLVLRAQGASGHLQCACNVMAKNGTDVQPAAMAFPLCNILPLETLIKHL